MRVWVLGEKADELIERSKMEQSTTLRKLQTLFGVVWIVFLSCMIYVIFPLL